MSEIGRAIWSKIKYDFERTMTALKHIVPVSSSTEEQSKILLQTSKGKLRPGLQTAGSGFKTLGLKTRTAGFCCETG